MSNEENTRTRKILLLSLALLLGGGAISYLRKRIPPIITTEKKKPEISEPIDYFTPPGEFMKKVNDAIQKVSKLGQFVLIPAAFVYNMHYLYRRYTLEQTLTSQRQQNNPSINTIQELREVNQIIAIDDTLFLLRLWDYLITKIEINKLKEGAGLVLSALNPSEVNRVFSAIPQIFSNFVVYLETIKNKFKDYYRSINPIAPTESPFKNIKISAPVPPKPFIFESDVSIKMPEAPPRQQNLTVSEGGITIRRLTMEEILTRGLLEREELERESERIGLGFEILEKLQNNIYDLGQTVRRTEQTIEKKLRERASKIKDEDIKNQRKIIGLKKQLVQLLTLYRANEKIIKEYEIDIKEITLKLTELLKKNPEVYPFYMKSNDIDYANERIGELKQSIINAKESNLKYSDLIKQLKEEIKKQEQQIKESKKQETEEEQKKIINVDTFLNTKSIIEPDPEEIIKIENNELNFYETPLDDIENIQFGQLQNFTFIEEYEQLNSSIYIERNIRAPVGPLVRNQYAEDIEIRLTEIQLTAYDWMHNIARARLLGYEPLLINNLSELALKIFDDEVSKIDKEKQKKYTREIEKARKSMKKILFDYETNIKKYMDFLGEFTDIEKVKSCFNEIYAYLEIKYNETGYAKLREAMILINDMLENTEDRFTPIYNFIMTYARITYYFMSYNVNTGLGIDIQISNYEYTEIEIIIEKFKKEILQKDKNGNSMFIIDENGDLTIQDNNLRFFLNILSYTPMDPLSGGVTLAPEINKNISIDPNNPNL